MADGHQEGEALSYAEITAIAAGDMRILEKVQLDADIQKIVHQERAFNREHTAVTNRIGDLNGTISRLDEDISTARSQILDGFVATTGDTFTCEVRDMKRLVATLPRIHTDRDDAGLAVQSLVTGQVRYALDRIYEYHQDHPMPLSQVEVRMGSVSFDASVRFNPKNPRNPDVRLAVSVLPSPCCRRWRRKYPSPSWKRWQSGCGTRLRTLRSYGVAGTHWWPKCWRSNRNPSAPPRAATLGKEPGRITDRWASSTVTRSHRCLFHHQLWEGRLVGCGRPRNASVSGGRRFTADMRYLMRCYCG